MRPIKGKCLILCATLALLFVQSAAAGEIALTFDDAPNGEGAFLTGLERTQTLIRKLNQLGVDQVAFFCTTEKLRGPEPRQRLEMHANSGHLLANHSHSHIHPGDLEADHYIADLDLAHDSLKQLPSFVYWFRYPFLDEGRTPPVRDSIRAALTERRYLNGYVTVDNYDWYMDRIVRLAREHNYSINMDSLAAAYVNTLWDGIVFYDSIGQAVLGRSPKHVLLLHENDLAAMFIDTLVNHIRANGWRIISPMEAYRDPIADSLPDVLMNNQGRVAAIAKAHGWRGRDLVHPSEDERYLDSLFTTMEIVTKPR